MAKKKKKKTKRLKHSKKKSIEGQKKNRQKRNSSKGAADYREFSDWEDPPFEYLFHRSPQSDGADPVNPAALALPPLVLPQKEQRKLRKRVLESVKRLRKSSKRLKEDLARYHDSDSKAYERWFRMELGAEKQKLDVLYNQLCAKNELIKMVFQEACWSKISKQEAYQRVIAPGYQPPGVEAFQEFTFGEEEDSFDEFELDEDECLEDFEEIFGGGSRSRAEHGEGLDPEQLLEEMFEELFGSFIGNKRERKKFFEEFKKEARQDGFYDEYERADDASDGEVGAPLDRRLVRLYRELVRKLHPDVCRQQGMEQKSLWNEVQAAYEQRDLKRLYGLRALFCLLRGLPDDKVSVADMNRARAEIKQDNRQLSRQIRCLKKLPAWNFSGLSEDELSCMRLEAAAEFNQRKAAMLADEQMIDRTIDSFKSRRKKRKTPASRKRAHERAEASGSQRHFEF